LGGAESEEIEKIGIETHGSAADAIVEIRVDTRASAKHAVHELAGPTTVAWVEAHRPPVERRVE
jgi:2-methylcitrate dehydratase PrpD